jgi:hypothetical protein
MRQFADVLRMPDTMSSSGWHNNGMNKIPAWKTEQVKLQTLTQLVWINSGSLLGTPLAAGSLPT